MRISDWSSDVCSSDLFDDDYASILMRTGRLSKSAWAEDPPSRCRRFVTNVRMAECDTAGDYEVVSYLYVERSRGDNWRNETITAERRAVWRALEGRYTLVRRDILCHQSTLGMANFPIFLSAIAQPVSPHNLFAGSGLPGYGATRVLRTHPP